MQNLNIDTLDFYSRGPGVSDFVVREDLPTSGVKLLFREVKRSKFTSHLDLQWRGEGAPEPLNQG